MEDLSKLSYVQLADRINMARAKAVRYDKIQHPDRDEAIRELIELDNEVKAREAAKHRPINDQFPYYSTT